MSDMSFFAPSSFWKRRIELSSRGVLLEDELALEGGGVPRLDDALEEADEADEAETLEELDVLWLEQAVQRPSTSAIVVTRANGQCDMRLIIDSLRMLAHACACL